MLPPLIVKEHRTRFACGLQPAILWVQNMGCGRPARVQVYAWRMLLPHHSLPLQ